MIVRHVAEMFTIVCTQASSASTETVSFWSVFSSMTVFTVQLFVVLCAVGGVQKLATQFAFEAHFMPFITTSNSLFGGIY
jgi:hypothetical protein